ncbi:hypothetical protein CALVIDRAFT_537276 [Calocera viscosa TUFC12733]|uniref:Uncharacterized protein n=1 Tax=Calocera viscosa (strain TUFC12733) TaxID=1330018 RepID=A0A167MAI3_CALVF|nr:hypothetical protein CALVIDRAFT_537276 [Calocera viscosa TUFC12733]
MSLGIPVNIGWQTVGPCHLYLHLKSSGRGNSVTSDGADIEPAEEAMSTTWSSGLSAHPSIPSRRQRPFSGREWDMQLDPSTHLEAVEVLTILDEAASEG